MSIVQHVVIALVLKSALPTLALAVDWPTYTDEEMFAKADYIVVGAIEEELPDKKDGLRQGRLKVEKTLLSEQGGGLRSMIVMYYGPDAVKTLGIKPGTQGVWLLRRTMAGNSVVHPQQFRPLAEEEKLTAALQAWLPVAFEEQVAKVKRLRTRDPENMSAEAIAAAILMFRRNEQLRLLPEQDNNKRQSQWLKRLQSMLALYDCKIDLTVDPKTVEEKQKLMEHLSRITGKEFEPGTPLYERMAAQAPGMLAHLYSGLIQQTVAADDGKFPDSVQRFQDRAEDVDTARLKTRTSALQYLVELASAGKLH